MLPHPTTPDDPTGGIDVTLADGSKEHWWQDPIDGFIRSRTGQSDPVDSYDTPSERLWHVPGGTLSPGSSPAPKDLTWAPSSEDVTKFASYQPAPGASIPGGGVPAVQRNRALSPDGQSSFDNPVLRSLQNYLRSNTPDVPAPSSVASDIPGSHFGRLLTNSAHLVPDDWPSYAQAASPPSAQSDPTGPDHQGSFNNPFGNSTSPQAPKLPPDFPELSSPDLPRGWSRMTPQELIRALPQYESGDALHQWFANWIRSFR